MGVSAIGRMSGSECECEWEDEYNNDDEISEVISAVSEGEKEVWWWW